MLWKLFLPIGHIVPPWVSPVGWQKYVLIGGDYMTLVRLMPVWTFLLKMGMNFRPTLSSSLINGMVAVRINEKREEEIFD